MPFSGFPESTVRFLAELSRNNDRAWFEAHREDCESAVIEPAKGFVEALGPRLKELDPKFDAADLLKALAKRANGSRSVALVGHGPQLSSVLAALAGVEVESLDVKKGAIVRLEARSPSQRGSAAAIWSLKPRSKTVKKGLPLMKADGEDANDGKDAAPRKRKKRAHSRRSPKTRSSRAAETDAPSPEADPASSGVPQPASESPAPQA